MVGGVFAIFFLYLSLSLFPLSSPSVPPHPSTHPPPSPSFLPHSRDPARLSDPVGRLRLGESGGDSVGLSTPQPRVAPRQAQGGGEEEDRPGEVHRDPGSLSEVGRQEEEGQGPEQRRMRGASGFEDMNWCGAEKDEVDVNDERSCRGGLEVDRNEVDLSS